MDAAPRQARSSPLQRPRRRRKRQQPKSSVGCATTLCVSLLVLTALGALVTTPRATPRSVVHSFAPSFPDRLLDLWPVHQESIHLVQETVSRRWLQSITRQDCLPSQHSHCQERLLGRDGTQHYVGIVRPPGVFGTLLQDYVIDLVDANRKDDLDMVIKVHPAVHVVQDYTLTRVVRTTVQPLLLHVMDLLLETVDSVDPAAPPTDMDPSDTFTVTDLTVDDVESVLRLLIRWHCHVSAATIVRDEDDGPTALYSLNLHDALALPPSTTTELASFLHVPYETVMADPHNVPLHLDGMAETFMRRLDECTRQWHGILERDTESHVETRLADAIQSEVEQCRYDTNTPHLLPIRPDESIASTRVSELVGSFLGDGSFETTTCRLYPQARLCHVA